MSQMPQLSVIIPFRDKPELTLECLNSLAAHIKHKPVELVLVDNGSTAETLSALRAFDQFPFHMVRADVPFNFQALINLGVKAATGDVALLLNNDIVLDERATGFVERFYQEAMQPDIGCVGCLLTYPDGSIQHAGVVVGMNTFADHLYRGWTLDQATTFPFSSPTADRCVSAVTAACLAIERRKFDAVGGMDERFIVCGGDVDLCLRVHEAGFKNLYLGSIAMTHAESKSRDPAKIPGSDFGESERSYKSFLARHAGRDPFYPAPLPLDGHAGHPPETLPESFGAPVSTPPVQYSAQVQESFYARVARLRRKVRQKLAVESPEIVLARAVLKLRKRLFGDDKPAVFEQAIRPFDYAIPHMQPIQFHRLHDVAPGLRLNVVLPHFDARGVFGGILTAAFFGFLCKKRFPQCGLRFVFSDGEGKARDIKQAMEKFMGEEARRVKFEICFGFDRSAQSIPCHRGDVFLATAWWTAYSAQAYHQSNPFIYLVQDYEPCFYPWGEEFAATYSTYHMNFLPVFNTRILQEYFRRTQQIRRAQLDDSLAFDPAINRAIGVRRPKKAGEKRVLLFYGRRTVARNLFGCGIQALDRAIQRGAFSAAGWEFLSAGERHDPVHLSGGCVMQSVGKLSLDEYLQLLSRVDVGLSLMLSPHPSYPPLELASAGAITVTNRFENKDLSELFERVESCDPAIEDVARALERAVVRVRNGESDRPLPESGGGSAFGTDWEKALLPAVEGVYAWMMEHYGSDA